MSYRALLIVATRSSGYQKTALTLNFGDDFYAAERMMDEAAKAGFSASHEAIVHSLTQQGAVVQSLLSVDDYEAIYADQRWDLELSFQGAFWIVRLSGRDASGDKIFFRKLEVAV